jgi:hypothetical protein
MFKNCIYVPDKDAFNEALKKPLDWTSLQETMMCSHPRLHRHKNIMGKDVASLQETISSNKDMMFATIKRSYVFDHLLKSKDITSYEVQLYAANAFYKAIVADHELYQIASDVLQWRVDDLEKKRRKRHRYKQNQREKKELYTYLNTHNNNDNNNNNASRGCDSPDSR